MADVDGLLVGYARCSTDEQDVTMQRRWLEERGVPAERVYIDHGRSGTTRAGRAGLDQALAAVRAGDRLLVPALDRLGRSVWDLLVIGQDLERRGVQLQIGDTLYDPADAVGRLFFQVLAVIAEFQASLIRHNTRLGMQRAREAGRLKGRAPKLSDRQRRSLYQLADAPDAPTVSELAATFKVSRATIYRELAKPRPSAAT
jgi:DNA invertase Pin-like site-specific DNA recombinase